MTACAPVDVFKSRMQASTKQGKVILSLTPSASKPLLMCTECQLDSRQGVADRRGIGPIQGLGSGMVENVPADDINLHLLRATQKAVHC